MNDLDGILDALELHRQRDALEASLRGLVEAFEMYNALGENDVRAQMKFLNKFSGAKLLLVELRPPAK